jgi:tetratricopeptide (TPR) repeat protein
MNNIKIAVLVTLILLISCSLFAFREKEIMLKQAGRYDNQRQYERAITIYETLLEDHPYDAIVIEKLIINLMRISKIKKAEKLFEDKGQYLSGMVYVKLGSSLHIIKGELKEAKKICRSFLDKNPGNINNYKIIAQIFTQYRQYEYAIEFLQDARKIAKDENLFIMEMAMNYQYLKNDEKAVVEYFKLLEHQKSYSNFILSKLKIILQENPAIIKNIEKAATKYSRQNALEIYALCLMELGEYNKALREYELLAPEKLKKFAEQQLKLNRYEIAVKAFDSYLQNVYEPNLVADVKIMKAKILIFQEKLNEAKKILNQLYNDKEIKKAKYWYKTRANRQCRELLAKISLMQDVPESEILQYMEEAKDYAFNKKEKNELDFQIIYYHIMTENYPEAKKILSKVLQREEPGSDNFKLGYFYSFQLALMEQDPAADSLLAELIINLPEHPGTNDALFLADLKTAFADDWIGFLGAYRLKMLHKDKKAIDKLIEIHANSENEKILFLAGEWAVDINDIARAEIIFNTEFQDEILKEYVVLKRVQIAESKQVRQNISREFLKTIPQSVFSPEFRKILEN